MTAIPLRSVALHALSFGMANAAAGVHEEGSNLGDQVQFWQKTVSIPAGSSWCDAFVYAMYLKSWCVAKGLLVGKTDHENRLIMLAHADAFTAETKLPRTGYCPTSADAAKKQGRFKPRDFMPSPGDQVLYDFKGQNEPHHTGLVISATATLLRVVEGNTSAGGSGSQDNGDGCYIKSRGRASVFGFVHLS